jgi:hypothetical protein
MGANLHPRATWLTDESSQHKPNGQYNDDGAQGTVDR